MVRRSDRPAVRVTPLRLAVSLGVAAMFLSLAALISTFAPVSVLTLRRHGSHEVSADVNRLVLFVIAVRGKTLAGVTGVSSRTYVAAAEPQPATNPADVTRPEAEGFLLLKSDASMISIPVSPSDIEAVERSVRDFLADDEPLLRLHLVSNWKIAVVAVTLVALPGLLILVGVARDVVSWRPRRE